MMLQTDAPEQKALKSSQLENNKWVMKSGYI